MYPPPQTNTILALWSVPRSISTGFERMMMERGDFTVIHEPFSYFFYAGQHAAAAVGMNVDGDQPQGFDAIRLMILRAAESRPVFFKDMSYHAISLADEGFLRTFVNSFIIRDPALTLVSHYKINPRFTLAEAGYESLYRLYEIVRRISDNEPAIVDGDDLVDDPYAVVQGYSEMTGIPFRPEALSWDAEFKREWKTWEIWHLDAAESTGFQKDMETFDLTVFDVPHLERMYEQCMPYYEELRAVRIKPRRSKDPHSGGR
jgi:hypothetical protein